MTECKVSRGGFTVALLSFAALVGATQTGLADSDDPPAEVGRLSRISGQVSLLAPGADNWDPATQNYPITTGNALWTNDRASAKVEVGGDQIYLAGTTEFDFDELDDSSLAASLAQGKVYTIIRDASSDRQYELDTPRGAIYLLQNGRYEIAAGDDSQSTTVTVYSGSARLVGPNINLALNAGESATLTGTNPVSVNVEAAHEDGFVSDIRRRERRYEAARDASNYADEMPGYEDLADYGRWRDVPDYGRVWVPAGVQSDWAPYRYGHWAFVYPWGWTWVDDAPWGFAPFHYGRWALVGNDWCWVPGHYQERPVYAPALVTFVGAVGGLSVSARIGGGGNVGWVPLAPEEVYVPSYHVSRTYIRQVNIENVRNETVINNYYDHGRDEHKPVENFRNARALTVVPTAALTESRPVAAASHDKTLANVKGLQSVGAGPNVQPTLATRGFTRGAAQKLNIQSVGVASPTKPIGAAPPTNPKKLAIFHTNGAASAAGSPKFDVRRPESSGQQGSPLTPTPGPGSTGIKVPTITAPALAVQPAGVSDQHKPKDHKADLHHGPLQSGTGNVPSGPSKPTGLAPLAPLQPASGSAHGQQGSQGTPVGTPPGKVDKLDKLTTHKPTGSASATGGQHSNSPPNDGKDKKDKGKPHDKNKPGDKSDKDKPPN